MTHNPAMSHVLMQLEHNGCFRNKRSVLELGNQTINLEEGCQVPKGFSVREYNGKSAEHYYRHLGFNQYMCLDSNDNHGAHVVDLNEYRTGRGGKGYFDLVTNNGTGEHIFDQANVFKLCHDACAEEGLMIHLMPCVNWINHGFYNYNPLLFADLANANGYEITRFGLCNRWGYTYWMDWKYEEMTQQIKPKHRQGSLLIMAAIEDVFMNEKRRTAAIFPNVMVIAVFRKVNDESFKVPMQGKYQRDISSDEIRERYA